MSNVAQTAVSAITQHLTKWSLHQIQGGVMNAAHAHASVSLLYKEKLHSNRPLVCRFIHFVTECYSVINLKLSIVELMPSGK